MRLLVPRRPTCPPHAFLVAACLLASVPAAWAGALETWRIGTVEQFQAGQFDGVVVGGDGMLRLSRVIDPAGQGPACDQVWRLIDAPERGLCAATGNEGRIFARPSPDEPWSIWHQVESSQVFSLAVSREGRIEAGTGPGGQVVCLSQRERPASRPDASVQYIWDLAFNEAGDLYAATGPGGQVWKRTGDRWEMVLDTGAGHVLCLAVARDGTVYAGTDTKGLIYRLPASGRPTVLYQAPQSEIRTLEIGPDGALYAATAQGSGERSNTTRRDPSAGAGPLRGVSFQDGKSSGEDAPSEDAPSEDENSVYRLDGDATALELWRSELVIHDLVWQGDRLLIATGPEGQLFELDPESREATLLARFPSAQILSLLARENGDLVMGLGDPGGVRVMRAAHAPRGEFLSEVFDAKLASRFGASECRASIPEGTRVELAFRTGNVDEPDPTWSDWHLYPTDGQPATQPLPAGRFVQARLTLHATNQGDTPRVSEVSLSYQTRNLAPRVTTIETPTVPHSDTSPREPTLELKWKASDPNDDPLQYIVEVKKDDWPDWIALTGDRPLEETTWEWDTRSMPAGMYRLRVTASDRLANATDEALSAQRVSEPFQIDHQPPAVEITPGADGLIKIRLRDSHTRLASASYALDGGPWKALFPTDGLFDTRDELVELDLDNLGPGVHLLRIQASDGAGNTGAGDVILRPGSGD